MKRIYIVTVQDDTKIPPEAKLVLQALLATNTKIEAKYGFTVTEASPSADPDPIPADPIPEPPPPPDAATDPLQPGAVLKFTMNSPRARYVAWSPAVDRRGWPVATGEKKCDGQLFLNGKKVEWIPVGRQNTGLVNALKRGKYYQANLKEGDVVALEIRDIRGKQRGYIGEATLTEGAE